MRYLKESNDGLRETAIYEVGKAMSTPFRAEFRRSGSRIESSGIKQRFNPKISIKNMKMPCFSCGQLGHFSSSSECPARGRTCRRCQQLGHFEIVCKKRKFSSGKPKVSSKAYNIETAPKPIKEPVEQADDSSMVHEKVYYAFYGGNESNVLEGSIGCRCESEAFGNLGNDEEEEYGL